MWTKPYGQTGKDVTVVGFGGMRFADPEDIDKNAEIVRYAHERGITYFDTAPFYCKDKSEEIMGAALRALPRESFTVSSKCMAADGNEFRASLEKSLKRLQVDRIDFFHIWCLVTPGQWEERIAGGAVAAAEKAKEEGLVGHVVCSAHLAGKDLASVLSEGVVEGVTLGYSAVNFPYREEAVQAAGRLGLGVAAMNPLAGGLIPQHADRFSFLQGPEEASVVAAALRFVVSHPDITCALVGFTTCEHIDEAVEAVQDFKPYDDERIAAIRGEILDSFDGFCTGCGYCLPCPEGVNIPRLMDAFNMRLMHGEDPKHIVDRLKWHWNMTPEAAKACALCGACEERCTQHLPIRRRIEAIADLADQGEQADR